jgi:hypothetical protein
MNIDISEITTKELEYLRQMTGRYNETPGELILWVLSDWITTRRGGEENRRKSFADRRKNCVGERLRQTGKTLI